jgi:carbonic anhydrase
MNVMDSSRSTSPPPLRSIHRACLLVVAGLLTASAWANEPAPEKAIEKIEMPIKKKAPSGDISASTTSNPKEVGNQVREALGTNVPSNKKLTLVIGGSGAAGHGSEPAAGGAVRSYRAPGAAKVASGHEEVHWSYEGEAGPANWGRLKPEFNVCAIGKRQSPINIEEGKTLAGPAEPVQFRYTPSNATVINNGHTIQVDVQGDNSITVRGSTYRLAQFHFHTPSEEQVNYKRFPMVAHLVHKNDEGQLAVVAILLEQGSPNELINKVWTYMPLDAGDRVQMPNEILNLGEILPVDQRYFQFIGSLTTPPCTEGVLWMVMKQPMQISKAQYRLFTQLYANNARPVQPVNGRPVRDAQ